MSMTKEKALNTIAALLQHTETDCDYAYDDADGSVDLLPGQDITDALRLAITAIREQEERRWIPVTERRPTDADTDDKRGYGCVEVYSPSSGVDVASVDWVNDFVNDVTHWRPLPQPPKEGAG